MKRAFLIASGLLLAGILASCKKQKSEHEPIRFDKEQVTKGVVKKPAPSQSSSVEAEGKNSSLRGAQAPTPDPEMNDEESSPSETMTVVEKIAAESAQESQLPTMAISSMPVSPKVPSLGSQLFKRGYSYAQQGRYEKAKASYLAACQSGHKEACHKFAYYEQKKGNFANAIRFYKLACQAGISKSCNNLGFGMESSGNLEAAKDFYSRACLQQHSISCKNLYRVTEKSKQVYSH